MGYLLCLIPEQLYVLVVMGIGFALVLGLVSRSAAAGLIGSLLLMVLLGPFVGALLEHLPWWLTGLMVIVFFLGLAKALLRLMVGKGATDEFMGHLLWAVFTLPFRLAGFFVRALFAEARGR